MNFHHIHFVSIIWANQKFEDFNENEPNILPWKLREIFLEKIEMFHKGDGNIKGNPAPMWHVLGSHHFFEKKQN